MGLKVCEENEGHELHEVYERHEGFEPIQVHKDNQGYEADFQALTAALHVIVFVWMLLCALMLITSSVRGHSRPFSPALTAALHVIVFICCIFTHHLSRRSMRLFRKH